MPSPTDFLLRSSRNIVEHCERLLATSTSEVERRRLKRIIADQMKFATTEINDPLRERRFAA